MNHIVTATGLLGAFGFDRQRLADGAEGVLCEMRSHFTNCTSRANDNTRTPIKILVPLADVAIWLSIGHRISSENVGWRNLCYKLANDYLFDLNN